MLKLYRDGAVERRETISSIYEKKWSIGIANNNKKHQEMKKKKNSDMDLYDSWSYSLDIRLAR